ncbi:hypothetical protein [Aestuariivirga litoralis]|uniref:hypothetical protein n=1 Tax=Aestuariivirga litoralis TaxID=2650924 RepID=UPI0018C81798|nr:hypothetical protein [Aestuariivirga litoralis]MBG1230948.1 hypothetical protein [Aestuariivirga litoralis]
MNVNFLPLLAWPWIAVFAAAALALVGFGFFVRARGMLLRAASGVLLVLALLNPVIHLDEREPVKDIALLVVDHSDSQKLGTRLAETDNAVEALKKRIEEIGNTELRIATVTSGTAQGGGTRGFAALNRALGDVPQSRFAGAIFLTDGEIHDVPEGKALAQLPSPIHGLISGAKTESDRKLVIDHAPEFTLVGQSAKISFHVEDQGGTGAGVPITLTQSGVEPKKLIVSPSAAAEVDVDISHAGKNFISLSAELRPGEISSANNTDLTTINGIRDRLRVLLVSGQPNPGERTWRNLLKADSAVDLVHFTILRPPEKQDGTPVSELSLIPFPTKELFIDKLDKFDLVIFDRYQREVILPDDYIANIADYVKKGGALLVASGPDFAEPDGLASTPLGDVLAAQPVGSVTEVPFKPLLTELGERHPVTQTLKGASRTDPKWGKWFRIIDATPATDDGSTQALMQGPDNKPLLVLRHVEEGRVAQILSDQGWLWARGYDGGGPEAEMLKRIAHWLMKEPELEEERLAAHAQDNDIIIDRYGLGDDYKKVEANSPSAKIHDVPLIKVGPGHFQGRFTPDEPGLYLLRDGKLEAVAGAGNGDAKEQSDLLATTKKLEPVAAATGGGVSWLADGLPRLSKQSPGSSYAGAGWMNLKANGLTRTIAVREWALSTSLFSLAIMLLAASLMWWREGR